MFNARTNEVERHRSPVLALLAVAAVLTSCIAATGCGADAGDIEEMLPAGHAPDWYARRLEQSGYLVLSINYERKDYAVYEVLKDAESFEIKLQIDTATGMVADVAVNEQVAL